MKKIYYLATASLLLAACAKNDPESSSSHVEEPVSAKGTIECEIPKTKTALDLEYNVVWTAGDVVKVFGESVKEGIDYTTQTNGVQKGTFESDGATVDDDVRFAVYPAAAVEGASLEGGSINVDFSAIAEQSYSEGLGTGTSVDKLPMVCKASTDKFVFVNTCGGVRFQVSDFNMEGISLKSLEVRAEGNEQIGGKAKVNLETGAVELSTEGTANKVTVKMEEGISILTEGSDSEYKSFVVFLPAGTYSKGFMFVLTDKDGAVYTVKTSQAVTIGKGLVTPLSGLKLKVWYGKANCLLTKAAGKAELDITPYYSFADGFAADGIPVVDASGSQKSKVSKAKILWQYCESASTADVLSSAEIIGSKLSVNATGTKGNALVAICNAEDEILWSYHIWVSDVSDIAGKNARMGDFHLMDRNLGALTAELGASLVDNRGCFYQWGRKDPFPRPHNSNSAKFHYELPFISASTKKLSVGSSLKHPTEFVTLKGSWTENELASLWGNPSGDKGVKSIYDPCPEGYKVPDPGIFAGNEWKAGDYTAQVGRSFDLDGNGTKDINFPSTGELSIGGDFVIMNWDARQYLWMSNAVSDPVISSGIDPGEGARFYFNKSGINYDGSFSAAGNVTRCQKVE